MTPEVQTTKENISSSNRNEEWIPLIIKKFLKGYRTIETNVIHALIWGGEILAWYIKYLLRNT